MIEALFDPDKLRAFYDFLARLVPESLAGPLFFVAKIVALVTLAIGGLATIVTLIAKIKKTVADEFLPIRFKPDHRRRAHQRRRFAEHLYDDLRRLDTEQHWSDHRFTELEAHVEAEGRRSAWFPLSLVGRLQGVGGIRLERSLTRAIDKSRERLILVEGEPGSGKSVALRHLARNLATRAKGKPNLTVPIPLYLNLKELHRGATEAIDRNMIEAFALRSLNRANDRDVAEFLETEFKRGKEQGTWIFLFDSFDEIPDILATVEPDATIAAYTQAISDFLSGLNECRGAVASRYFRGPGQVSWPRFKILALNEERRAALIERAELKPDIEREVLGRLSLAASQFGPVASNPMFLGLLCEHMRSGQPFPDNLHGLFEGYFRSRFDRDAERVRQRYQLEIEALREIAETVAFCMAAEDGLGISAQRERIELALQRQGFAVPADFSARLDALEFLKLARSETEASGARLFTFGHRRFQEYFATCVVLRAPDRVSARGLLLDGRWRETATVICQTASAETLVPILAECWQYLDGLREAEDYVRQVSADGTPAPREEFYWPPGLLHVLNLLQEGFRGRLEALPQVIRTHAGNVIARVDDRATLAHRKWALEVAGAAPEEALLDAIRSGFASRSQWLSQVAYWQVSRLPHIPDDITRRILEALLLQAVRRKLWRDRHATRAHLSRLNPNARFLDALRLLLAIPFIDLLVLLLVLFLVSSRQELTWPYVIVPLAMSLCLWWGTPVIVAWYTSLGLRSVRAVPRPVVAEQLDPAVVFARRAAIQPPSTTGLLFLGLLMVVALRLVVGVRGQLSSDRFSALQLWPLFWAPLAYLAVFRGRFVSIVWWPILPVWPLLDLLHNARQIASAFASFLVKAWRVMFALAIVYAGLGLLAVGVERVGSMLGNRAVGFLAIAALLIGGMAVFVVGWSYLTCRDWLLVRAFAKESASALNGETFLTQLGRLRLNPGRAAYVRAIRARGVLKGADAPVVVALANAIEGIDVGSCAQFDRWRAAFRKPPAFDRWSVEVLDEVSALREATQGRGNEHPVSPALHAALNSAR